MISKYKLSLHVSVMLFGGAGLFAESISHDPYILVWGRALWAIIMLFILSLINSEQIGQLKNILFGIFLSGAILALHWVSFFKSIQDANVAVGVLTFSTFPLFTVAISPLFNLGKASYKKYFWGLMTLVGVAVMVPYYELNSLYLSGIFWGLLSAFSFALLTLTNKTGMRHIGPFTMALLQNLGAAIFLTPFVSYNDLNLSLKQHFLWFLLGTVFTGLSHGLFVYSLKGTDATKASLIAALEPVYAILWAILIFYELPSKQEIIGGLIILSAVVLGNKK